MNQDTRFAVVVLAFTVLAALLTLEFTNGPQNRISPEPCHPVYMWMDLPDIDIRDEPKGFTFATPQNPKNKDKAGIGQR